jgi:hypothetical protein
MRPEIFRFFKRAKEAKNLVTRKRDSIFSRDVATPTPLETEIEQCLLYFEGIQRDARDRVIKALNEEAAERGKSPLIIPEILKEPIRLKSIHGRKYTVGRLEKGYFWEAGDNVRHTIGKEMIPGDIIQEIQNITLPYAPYVKSRKSNT